MSSVDFDRGSFWTDVIDAGSLADSDPFDSDTHASSVWGATAGFSTALEHSMPRFDSADAAAQAVLDRANPRSVADNVEYAGVILRDGFGTFATNPRAGTDRGAPTYIDIGPGLEVLGTYHTHGDYSQVGLDGAVVRTGTPTHDSFQSDQFSAADEISYLRASAKVPGFLGYLGTPSGDFRKYDTGTITDTVFASQASPLATLARSGGHGALIGGLADGWLGLKSAMHDDVLTATDARHVVSSVGHGALAGGAFSLTEHALWGAADRGFGLGVERGVGAYAARLGAADAGAFGALGRSLATRAASAGGAGAILGSGLSVYENFDGLARGDADAIGNVAGDAVVGAGAAWSGAAVGATIGSFVPVFGTALGAVVGMGAGMASDAAMRRWGVDTMVADTVGSGIDAGKALANNIGRWLDR